MLHAADGCASPRLPSSVRIAHVILANPFSKALGHGRATTMDSVNRDENQGNGPAPGYLILRMHLWAIAQLNATQLSAVLVMVPTDTTGTLIEHDNYTDVSAVESLLPCPVRIIRITNNTLGSYGMAMHAFATTRDEFDYYIAVEQDYMPIRAHFETLLVHAHRHVFGDEPGVLFSVLEGRPAEPHSRLAMCGQGQNVLSKAAFERVFDHLYDRIGWRHSTSDRMEHLTVRVDRLADGGHGQHGRLLRHRWDRIQEGFGHLMWESSVRMHDSSSVWRSPYWAGQKNEIIMYTAGLYDKRTAGFHTHRSLAMDRLILAPAPMLFMSKVVRCCGAGKLSCLHSRCVVSDWRRASDCCSAKINSPRAHGQGSKLCANLTAEARAGQTPESIREAALRGVLAPHLHGNCSHLDTWNYALPLNPYLDAPDAICVLTQPPAWAPAWKATNA